MAKEIMQIRLELLSWKLRSKPLRPKKQRMSMKEL